MKYFSLFSGIGGFELGIQNAYVALSNRNKNGKIKNNKTKNAKARKGLVTAQREIPESVRTFLGELPDRPDDKRAFTCVGYSEINKYAIKIYETHFPDHKNYGDITKINAKELPNFDLLLGGFPCQPFSIAGYRRGFLDTGRGDLFFVIVKILRDKKPQAVFLENVKNLKTHDGGKTFKIISEALEDLGYHVKVQVLNSAKYGNVPQNRERVYIVGFKSKKMYDAFEFPKEVTLTKKISDILEKEADKKYYYNDSVLYKQLKEVITKENVIYQWRRAYVRENKSGVCPTLTANMGMGGHNVPLIKDKKGIRKLTPRECARLQGFPDGWHKVDGISDTQAYKVYGNAVTTNVITEIIKRIYA